jgi:hypothetical protein
MGSLTLLDRAREAGLSVSADGDRLIIRGPRKAMEIARDLMNRKDEVLALLAVQGRSPHAALFGPSRTPWGTWAWSDSADLQIETFDQLFVLSLPSDKVRWRCLNPYCLHETGWWLSPQRVVQCLNCRPPASPDLVVARGTEADAPEVLADRTTTYAGVWPYPAPEEPRS